MIRYLYLAIGICGLMTAITAAHLNGWRIEQATLWLLVHVSKFMHHHR